MNEIILQQRYIKRELKTASNQMSSNVLLKKIIVKKFRTAQSVLTHIKKPNIKEANSEKRYDKHSERNFIKQHQNPQGKILVSKQPITQTDNKQIKKEAVVHSNGSLQLLSSKKLLDPRQKLLFKSNNKGKQLIQGENKINNTFPLMKKNISKKMFNESKKQQHISHLNKSYSCKYRFNTYLINAQQLGQIFKNNQGKQANSNVALRMKNGKKRFYDHTISNLFSIINKNVMIGKAQSEMPEELGIKQMIIPKREVKMSKNIHPSIQTKDNKMVANDKNKGRQKFPYKMRQVTEKMKGNRIRTQQYESKQLWSGLEKPFEPWQFERISSNFFY